MSITEVAKQQKSNVQPIIVKSGHPVISNNHKPKLWMFRKELVKFGNQNNYKLTILSKNIANACCECHMVQCEQQTCRKS